MNRRKDGWIHCAIGTSKSAIWGGSTGLDAAAQWTKEVLARLCDRPRTGVQAKRNPVIWAGTADLQQVEPALSM